MTKYTFVIDTDKYAGNFERDMCAYITGHIGDCEVGTEWAQKFAAEFGTIEYDEDSMFFNIDQVADDHDCYRPCYIQPTPGWINDGWGGHYPDTLEGRQQALARCKQEGAAYYTKHRDFGIERLQRAQAGDTRNGWTIEACERDIAHHNERITHYESLTAFTPHAAYNSVGIFFRSKPTTQQIELMKQRAHQFTELYRVAKWGQELLISGFRLLRTTTQEEVAMP